MSVRPLPSGLSGPSVTPPALRPEPEADPGSARRKMPMMRKFNICYLDEAGHEAFREVVAPAKPVFEATCSAFGHLTAIMTESGPVPVGDLAAGTMIVTRGGQLRPLMWVGSITFVPQIAADPQAARMTRVAADSFGLERPMCDTLFGPAARHLGLAPRLALADEDGHALMPVSDAEDHCGIVPVTPMHPVRLYHVMLDRHAVIYANGMPVESFHPGLATLESMGPNMRALFMSLFPHLKSPSQFGQVACARLSSNAVIGLDAA